MRELFSLSVRHQVDSILFPILRVLCFSIFIDYVSIISRNDTNSVANMNRSIDQLTCLSRRKYKSLFIKKITKRVGVTITIERIEEDSQVVQAMNAKNLNNNKVY